MNRESCPLCELPNIRVYRGYEVLKCSDCGLLYFGRIPSELELYDYYSGYTYDALKATESAVINSIKNKLIELKKLTHQQNPVLLDFGCGQGDVVDEAAKLGFESYGFEYSAAAVKLCRERGLTVLSHEELTKKSFSVITAFEVIEHLIYPADFLRMMNSILKPQGILFITTPNSGALSVRLFRETSLVYPEHLTAFSKWTVRVMQRKFNFKLESAVTEGIKSKAILNVRNRIFRNLAERNTLPYNEEPSSASDFGSRNVAVGSTDPSMTRGQRYFSRLIIWTFQLVRWIVNVGVDRLSLGETLKITLRRRP